MYKFIHQKNNEITSIFTGKTKQDCIKYIFDRYVRYKLICEGIHYNKDGSVFKIIKED